MDDDQTKQIADQTEIPAEDFASRINGGNRFFSAKILRLILIVAVSCLISLALGLFMGNTNSKTITTTRQVYKLTNNTNPVIPSEVINNQMFSEWSGKVKGRISQIYDNQIDITSVEEIFTNTGKRAIKDSKNPNPTRILVIPEQTEFFSYEYSSGNAQFIAKKTSKTQGDLRVGNIIDGSIKIQYDTNTGATVLVGSSLSVRNKE